MPNSVDAYQEKKVLFAICVCILGRRYHLDLEKHERENIEYPELTGEESDFIETQYELDAVYDYAWEYSGYEELYGGYIEKWDQKTSRYLQAR